MKKFLIIGNGNAVTYKDIFPYIKENKIWFGVSSNVTMEFKLPEHYEKWSRVENGVKYGKCPAISWFTNIGHKKHNTPLKLYKRYSTEYPKYENYNAINVDKVSDIPMDYYGIMGVPITFISNYCPEQFEIVGATSSGSENVPDGWQELTKDFLDVYYKQKGFNRRYKELGGKLAYYYDKKGNGVIPYKRILIKRK